MNIRHLLLSPTLLALCALPVGCATDDPATPEASDPFTPIAALALPNGNQLEFYEPSPGNVMMSEAGIVGAAPTPRDGRTPVEMYRDLSPDHLVPGALVAAAARAEALHPATPVTAARPATEPKVSSVAPGAPASFIDNQSCDDHWFSDNFCGSGFDWEMCLLNHLNGAFASLSSVDWVQHATCADIGAITLKVSMGDGAGGLWDVLEGHWRSFVWHDTSVFGDNQSTRGDFLNASGNRFHYAVNANF
jgi:hypothetical protein